VEFVYQDCSRLASPLLSFSARQEQEQKKTTVAF